MSRIINTDASASIGCMYLEENGIIGYHQAVVPQLLLILDGDKVQTGDAIFGEKD